MINPKIKGEDKYSHYIYPSVTILTNYNYNK